MLFCLPSVYSIIFENILEHVLTGSLVANQGRNQKLVGDFCPNTDLSNEAYHKLSFNFSSDNTKGVKYDFVSRCEINLSSVSFANH